LSFSLGIFQIYGTADGDMYDTSITQNNGLHDTAYMGFSQHRPLERTTAISNPVATMRCSAQNMLRYCSPKRMPRLISTCDQAIKLDHEQGQRTRTCCLYTDPCMMKVRQYDASVPEHHPFGIHVSGVRSSPQLRPRSQRASP
jgi:hypothetical protein